MANENKTVNEYVKKGYLITHLANCGIRTINYDEWERLCECIHEAKPADVVEVVRCKDCKYRKIEFGWHGKRYKMCANTDYPTDDDAFCSYGERR